MGLGPIGVQTVPLSAMTVTLPSLLSAFDHQWFLRRGQRNAFPLSSQICCCRANRAWELPPLFERSLISLRRWRLASVPAALQEFQLDFSFPALPARPFPFVFVLAFTFALTMFLVVMLFLVAFPLVHDFLPLQARL